LPLGRGKERKEAIRHLSAIRKTRKKKRFGKKGGQRQDSSKPNLISFSLLLDKGKEDGNRHSAAVRQQKKRGIDAIFHKTQKKET